MDIFVELVGTIFLVTFLVATFFNIVTDLFPGLSAKQADMQDRIDRTKDAIKEFNSSNRSK